MRRILRIIVRGFILVCIGMTCSIDHGIAPLPGTLGVDVIFLNDQIPDNTEGVYLFVAPEFPPHAINELYLSPNSIPLENDTVYTELALPFGRYEAIGLWWYNRETQSNLADILTLKLNDEFLPYSFQLSADNPAHRTTLPANLNRVDRDATIRGTIRFNGPFPENTLATAVAAYIQQPTEDVEYLIYLKSMDFSVDSNPYEFTLPVESAGGVGYLAVFWLSERSGLDDFKTIGFYEDPGQPGQPGQLRLRENETVTGIDIQTDWSLIR